MAKKKRRGIGHITSEENKKISDAIDEAFHGCVGITRGNEKVIQARACSKGVLSTERELEKRGFSIERHAKDFTSEMGHITEEEDRKVNDSLEAAHLECDRRFFHDSKGQRKSCNSGVDKSARALQKRGFKATVHAVSGRRKKRG